MKRDGLFLTFGFILMLLFQPNLHAQEASTASTFFSMTGRTGENRPHREVIKNLTYPYRGIDLKMGWQSHGTRPWQAAYRFPSYGIGLNWSTFNTDIIGNPYAVYFFTSFPQITTQWLRLDLELNLGLANGIRPYDPFENPNNFSTGSSMNVFFGLFLEQSFHLGKRIDLYAAEGFAHYSNGALSYPNLGLNTPTLKVGLRYHPKGKSENIKASLPDNFRQWILETYLGTGTKKMFAPEPNYQQVLLSPSIFYRPSFKRRIGMGVELAYNEAITGVRGKEELRGTALLTFAIHASHEFLINRFGILTQFGIYVHNMPSDKFYYERLGLSYALYKNIKIVLNLKAHYFKAEYVETGLVFDLSLGK